ncbi:MAG: substrate-binding domain-containing protein [Candidatus Bathyarchaeia archaeon]
MSHVTKKHIAITVFVIASVSATGILLSLSGSSERPKLIVSTTTSLYDTGLLDALEDDFEDRYRIDVYFIPAGTGLAITHARRGDSDMILVHAPSQELEFIESGYGVCRKIFAYNFFAIVGPPEDPASISGLSTPEALVKIFEAGRTDIAQWVSRGDGSGTHLKEEELWAAAGYNITTLRDERWYHESGTGMGDTLRIANEMGAYTLTDMGTYLKYKRDGLIGLVVLVGQDKELLNAYSAIAVSPDVNPEVNFEGALTFIRYLTSDDGQEVIANYGLEEYGKPLFQPAVKLLKERTDPTLAEWVERYACFNGTECPCQCCRSYPELYLKSAILS